ncbi:unnamed protein product [Linum tenue]|nr:unnamed protein product [Linum tenue]
MHAASSANSSGRSTPSSNAPIFILDPRKSLNAAIVLKSLATTQNQILSALQEGYGVRPDILEKLAKISPTKEEATRISRFNGDPGKLADAESFLYSILKAVPTAFFRVEAMLFRSSYNSEIRNLKMSLKTVELGCQELRERGLFLKLLEAILKAGNKMNAGTSRGDAKGFNLTALRKLSDIKSTDGETTLLRFVVEQVVRSEGKRQVSKENSTMMTEEERKEEFLSLGLRSMQNLGLEFSNVKKAAAIESREFITTCSALAARQIETKRILTGCKEEERGEFMREMRGFLDECEEELRSVIEEQERVMELVKRTTTYYQVGGGRNRGAGEQPLELFVIVKDFLDMVDRVCTDISRSRSRKKNGGGTNSTRVRATATLPPAAGGNTSSGKQVPRFFNFSPASAAVADASDEEDDDF